MNSVLLIGRWTKEIQLTYTQGNNSTAVAKGTLAVNRRYKQQGQPEADFIPIVIWGKQAENTANYCGAKGNLISIRGRIQTRNYDNKEGQKVYVTEVVAEETEFLNSKSSGEAANNSSVPTDYEDDITPIDDGDIPF